MLAGWAGKAVGEGQFGGPELMADDQRVDGVEPDEGGDRLGVADRGEFDQRVQRGDDQRQAGGVGLGLTRGVNGDGGVGKLEMGRGRVEGLGEVRVIEGEAHLGR